MSTPEDVRAIHERLGLSVDSLLLTLARCAFADERRLYRDDGSTKALHELDDDIAPAIEDIEVTEVGEGESLVRTYAYTLASRSAALKTLKRHLRTEMTADEVNVLVALLKSSESKG